MIKAARTRVYRNDQRLLASMLGLSLACHVVIGLFLTLVPSFIPKPSELPPYVTVNLVNMPAYSPAAPKSALPSAPAAGPPAIAPVEPEPVEEEPLEAAPPPEPKAAEKAPEVKPAEKEAVKPTEKPAEKLGTRTADKKPEAKPAETEAPPEDYEAGKKSALAELRQRVEAKERSDSINKAIAALRKKVAAEGGVSVGTAASSGIAPGLSGSEGLSDAVAIPKVMTIYSLDLTKHINAHWAYESSLAGKSRKLLAEVVLTITRNGNISDYFFTQRSGNAYFDESVEKAIKKSNPAPSLPPAYGGDKFQFGLTFIPPE